MIQQDRERTKDEQYSVSIGSLHIYQRGEGGGRRERYWMLGEWVFLRFRTVSQCDSGKQLLKRAGRESGSSRTSSPFPQQPPPMLCYRRYSSREELGVPTSARAEKILPTGVKPWTSSLIHATVRSRRTCRILQQP